MVEFIKGLKMLSMGTAVAIIMIFVLPLAVLLDGRNSNPKDYQNAKKLLMISLAVLCVLLLIGMFFRPVEVVSADEVNTLFSATTRSPVMNGPIGVNRYINNELDKSVEETEPPVRGFVAPDPPKPLVSEMEVREQVAQRMAEAKAKIERTRLEAERYRTTREKGRQSAEIDMKRQEMVFKETHLKHEIEVKKLRARIRELESMIEKALKPISVEGSTRQ